MRRDERQDQEEATKFEIPEIDLIMVDLYPFEETVRSGADEKDIIEKIDIGGVSLIRAAAKNYKDTLIVAQKEDYQNLVQILRSGNGETQLEQRKEFASSAFNLTSHYDGLIFQYFDQGKNTSFKQSFKDKKTLRYGENPHQQGMFFGKLDEVFEQLHGKEISYNNLVDADAALNLVREFSEPTFAVIKHTNPCGLASRKTLKEAWTDALAGDPVSAFGGVIACNREMDEETAMEMDKLFFEILIVPGYSSKSLEILKSKKNRILLVDKGADLGKYQFKSILNGVIFQDKDLVTEEKGMLKNVTKEQASEEQIQEMIFASKISKHTKSNTIVLSKNKQLVGIGCGQTSRVDALEHAIHKAKSFNLPLSGAVMASDAFFPFPDCVEIAHKAGVAAILQPGGSVKDELSINYCNENGIPMVFSGIRHFKH